MSWKDPSMNRSVVLFVVLIFAPALRADDVDDALAALQGRWSVERLEENGKAELQEEIKKFSISVEGTKFVVSMDGRDESMAIKIDPGRSPKWVNLTPNFGDDKGKTSQG